MEGKNNQIFENQDPTVCEESTIETIETVESTPKKSKKKLAIILGSVGAAIIAIAVTLAVLLGGNSGANNSNSVKTPEEEAQECVKFQMMAEMVFKSLGGADISFVSCTFGTTKSLGNNNFKISGTVKVRDEYGNFHVGNYTAQVTYDADYDDYDADIEYGTFSKQ